MELKNQTVHKSLYAEIKKFEENCSNYTMKRESDIVDIREVAGIKQTTEWGALKQCLTILGPQGLINVIKQLDINTNLNRYKQT